MAFICSFQQMKTKDWLQRNLLTTEMLIPRELGRKWREIVQSAPCVQKLFLLSLHLKPIFYLALFSLRA